MYAYLQPNILNTALAVFCVHVVSDAENVLSSYNTSTAEFKAISRPTLRASGRIFDDTRKPTIRTTYSLGRVLTAD